MKGAAPVGNGVDFVVSINIRKGAMGCLGGCIRFTAINVLLYFYFLKNSDEILSEQIGRTNLIKFNFRYFFGASLFNRI